MNATMPSKMDLLNAMTGTLAAPGTQIKRPGLRTVKAAPRALTQRKTVVAEAPLWRVTMAAVEPVRWERVLSIALAASSVAALVWLALTCLQFFYAWGNLVVWVRAAMA